MRAVVMEHLKRFSSLLTRHGSPVVVEKSPTGSQPLTAVLDMFSSVYSLRIPSCGSLSWCVGTNLVNSGTLCATGSLRLRCSLGSPVDSLSIRNGFPDEPALCHTV
jgi:hypothetical protein